MLYALEFNQMLLVLYIMNSLFFLLNYKYQPQLRSWFTFMVLLNFYEYQEIYFIFMECNAIGLFQIKTKIQTRISVV